MDLHTASWISFTGISLGLVLFYYIAGFNNFEPAYHGQFMYKTKRGLFILSELLEDILF